MTLVGIALIVLWQHGVSDTDFKTSFIQSTLRYIFEFLLPQTSYFIFIFYMNHHAYWSDWIQILTARTYMAPNFFSHCSGASDLLSKRLLLVVCDRCLKKTVFPCFQFILFMAFFRLGLGQWEKNYYRLFNAFKFKIFFSKILSVIQ